MKLVSTFAGIGGFDLGFQRAGFEVIAHAENDPNCSQLLAEKFPHAVALNDVRALLAVTRRMRRGQPVANYEDWKRRIELLRTADVWTAGFPCQDLSVAGAFGAKGYGQDAQKEDVAPTLRSMNNRDSNANGGGQVAIAFQTRIARNGRGQPEEIAPALNGSDAGATSDMRPCVAAHAFGVRRLTPTEFARLQGFPDDWAKGFSDSVQYRMYGNAFPPPMAEWVAKRLLAVHNRSMETTKVPNENKSQTKQTNANDPT